MRLYWAILSIGLYLTACTNTFDNKEATYTLPVLQDNMDNKQGLLVEKNVKIGELCEGFKKQSLEEIEQRLTNTKGLGLYEASYGLHYLGNRHLQNGNFQKGLKYLKVATEQYINPLSALKLARMYFMETERLDAEFPDQSLDGFSQDWMKAYYYINLSMRLTEHITGGRRGHYLINVVVFNGVGILDHLMAYGRQGKFDADAAHKKYEPEVAQHIERYKRMYGEDIVEE